MQLFEIFTPSLNKFRNVTVILGVNYQLNGIRLSICMLLDIALSSAAIVKNLFSIPKFGKHF
jgi:hypothetical protein